MTQVFHQLRTRSRALAHGLLLVLLATWLSAVCPHCLAQTDLSQTDLSQIDHSGAADAPVPEASMHCRGDMPPPADPQADAHGWCPKAPGCSGGNCAQMMAIDPGEPLLALISEVAAPACVTADFITYAYPSTPPPSAPTAHAVVFADCPLYLRHCTFLN